LNFTEKHFGANREGDYESCFLAMKLSVGFKSVPQRRPGPPHDFAT